MEEYMPLYAAGLDVAWNLDALPEESEPAERLFTLIKRLGSAWRVVGKETSSRVAILILNKWFSSRVVHGMVISLFLVAAAIFSRAGGTRRLTEVALLALLFTPLSMCCACRNHKRYLQASGFTLAQDEQARWCQ